MNKGILITFEGGEGCGKSSQIKLLAKYLEEKNIPYIVSREPGGTVVGEQIREILLHTKNEISSNVEFLLFSASRAEHIEKVVKPALNEGKVVLLDRYYDSSYTYQGIAGNLDMKEMQEVTDFAINGAKPDLTLLLDLSYEDGMKRKSIDENLKNLDRIEQKGKEYHDKVRNGYLTLAKMFSDRIVIVDASKSKEEVFSQIENIVENRFHF